MGGFALMQVTLPLLCLASLDPQTVLEFITSIYEEDYT